MGSLRRQCRWRGALLQVCYAWCLVFLHAMISGMDISKSYEDEGHHPRYRWWRGVLKVAVARTSPTGA